MHQVRHDDAEEICAIGRQRTRVLIGAVVHPLRSVKDTCARFGADFRVIVDGARDRHLGDAKLTRDVS